MAKWEVYTGSDEQLAEMLDAVENGFMLNSTKAAGVFKGGDFMSSSHLFGYLEYCEATHYLICQPHPYADEIKIWADTRCPVYYQAVECKDFKGECLSDEFNLYPFARPDRFEYRLTPFED